MLRLLHIIVEYVKLNLMAAMEYRSAFALQALGMAVQNLVMVFFWSVFFSQFPPIHGWGVRETLTIWALTASGFGLAHIVCGNSFNIARIIATGGLDYYLALPFDTLTHVLVSRMSLSAWGDLFFGIVLALILRPGDLSAFGLFLLGSLCTAVVFVAFAVAVGSLAFFIGNAEGLGMQVLNAFMNLSTYPADVFPGPIRMVLYTLVPAALATTLPASIIQSFTWNDSIVLVSASLALALISRVLFHIGLRRYESGNLLIMRT